MAGDKDLDSKSFEEIHLTLTEEQVKKETARCLSCGKNVVDSNKCIGCGVCTTKCEFDAIHLYRDVPGATDMVTAEEKFNKMIPHELKRVGNITIHKSDKAVAIIPDDDEHYFVDPSELKRENWYK